MELIDYKGQEVTFCGNGNRYLDWDGDHPVIPIFPNSAKSAVKNV